MIWILQRTRSFSSTKLSILARFKSTFKTIILIHYKTFNANCNKLMRLILAIILNNSFIICNPNRIRCINTATKIPLSLVPHITKPQKILTFLSKTKIIPYGNHNLLLRTRIMNITWKPKVQIWLMSHPYRTLVIVQTHMTIPNLLINRRNDASKLKEETRKLIWSKPMSNCKNGLRP